MTKVIVAFPNFAKAPEIYRKFCIGLSVVYAFLKIGLSDKRRTWVERCIIWCREEFVLKSEEEEQTTESFITANFVICTIRQTSYGSTNEQSMHMLNGAICFDLVNGTSSG